MMKKPRIALITVWFPPQMSVATSRMLAFVEYLSADFEIEVFALNDKAGSELFREHVNVHYESGNRIDRLLKSNTSDGAFRHKAKTALRIIRSKVQPGLLSGWRKKTTRNLIRRHSEQPFDIVISSYAPEETHEAVLAFKAQFPDIPWIADMRDEMSLNPHILPHLNEKLRALELKINKQAVAITTVSKPILDEFRRLCPDVTYYREIRNGYNHELVFPTKEPGDKMKIGYFGSFYGKRKPDLFFQALMQVMENSPGFDVEIYFVGAHRNFDIPDRLKANVVIENPLSYLDAIRRMAEMDVNLMIEPTSERKGVFTGKLFDYLSVRRPVLALVDKDDVAAQLIDDTSAGYTGEYGDMKENKQAITAVIEDWKKGTLNHISVEDAAQLHRKFQVEKLKELINEITGQ